MTTEYAVDLDRDACEGVFACLVRDERFVEAADGLATVCGADDRPAPGTAGDAAGTSSGEPSVADAPEDAAERDDPTAGTVTATFDDDRLEAARSAAAACPLDAIAVRETGGEGADE